MIWSFLPSATVFGSGYCGTKSAQKLCLHLPNGTCHLKSKLIDEKCLEESLHIFETQSSAAPLYIMMLVYDI